MNGLTSIGNGGTLPPPRSFQDYSEMRDRLERGPNWTCARCSSVFPVAHWGDEYNPHVSRCFKRSLSTTLRNLAGMYWKLLRGRGCATYIREQERDHLHKIIRRAVTHAR